MPFWNYCRVGLNPEKQEIFFGWPGITAPVIFVLAKALEDHCPDLEIKQNSPVTVISAFPGSPAFIVGWYIQLDVGMTHWNQVLHVVAKCCQEHGLSYEAYDSRILSR